MNSADSITTREGRVPFEHPTLPKSCSTWYKIVSNSRLKSSTTISRPLICMHGGPGAGHNYLLSLQFLAKEYGVTVVFYDQIGCGNSTHLDEKRLDSSFWTPDFFIAEFRNLLKHLEIQEYDLLGQSWGGMLGSQFATLQPEGLRRLVIANSPASMELWVESCNEWRAELPEEIEAALQKYEKLQDYKNKEYEDAVLFFYKRHLCLIPGENGEPFPDIVMQTLNLLESNDTVYYTMNGPSEFTVIGNLKTWSVISDLHKINVPTLVVNGEFDEARATCVSPFAEKIPGATWRTMKDTSHMSHVEKTAEYCEMIVKFLKGEELPPA